MVQFAIVMATYHRPNGNSKSYVERSIQSIINQIHTDWFLFVVSDKYEPESELIDIINSFNDKRIILLKNDMVERDFIKEKIKLWNVAGATSMNVGLKHARSQNFKYYCHLDDDDFWKPSHLKLLSEVYEKYPQCVFANTKSTYKGSVLPVHNVTIMENNYLPTPCGMIHSSISFRCDIIDFKYYTAFNPSDVHGPADADMLGRIRQFILDHVAKSYSSVYIPELTCYHDIESECSY